MAQTLHLHSKNPQPERVDTVVGALRDGAVLLYPTDTVWAIGCDLNSKSAIERVRRLKRLANDKPLTFLCPSLSNIAAYANVSDRAYRLMRHLIPGPFTFLLPATKLVPRLVLNPKRKTTGIRVPNHTLCQALLVGLGNPLISTSAHLSDGSEPELEVELFEGLDRLVDVIVRTEDSPDIFVSSAHVSTVIDLTADEPVIVRQGLGWERVMSFLS